MAQSKRDAKDPECPRIEIIGIRDGRRILKIDDGHAKGNPSKPNAQRQVIVNLLNKNSEIDDLPLFVLAKRGEPFVLHKNRCEPIKGEVWSAEHEERSINHQEDAESKRLSARPMPNPLRAAIVASTVDATDKQEKQAAPLAAKPKAAPVKPAPEKVQADKGLV